MAANTPIWKGLPPGYMTETAGSGKFQFAERIYFTQQLAGRKADADAWARAHHRGSYWTLLWNGWWEPFCVEESTSELERGGKGIVTVKYVYLGLVPPDEFALPPFEVHPPLERHPMFVELTENDLKLARAEFNAATEKERTSIQANIETKANKLLIRQLLAKWRRGADTYYLAGLTFMHTVFSTTPPLATLGGYIEDPWGAFSGYVSHSGMSWLRKADEVVWCNGLWKLTRTWFGGPDGHWDPDLYPPP